MIDIPRVEKLKEIDAWRAFEDASVAFRRAKHAEATDEELDGLANIIRKVKPACFDAIEEQGYGLETHNSLTTALFKYDPQHPDVTQERLDYERGADNPPDYEPPHEDLVAPKGLHYGMLRAKGLEAVMTRARLICDPLKAATVHQYIEKPVELVSVRTSYRGHFFPKKVREATVVMIDDYSSAFPLERQKVNGDGELNTVIPSAIHYEHAVRSSGYVLQREELLPMLAWALGDVHPVEIRNTTTEFKKLQYSHDVGARTELFIDGKEQPELMPDADQEISRMLTETERWTTLIMGSLPISFTRV